jgi:hypothetical protein
MKTVQIISPKNRATVGDYTINSIHELPIHVPDLFENIESKTGMRYSSVKTLLEPSDSDSIKRSDDPRAYYLAAPCFS